MARIYLNNDDSDTMVAVYHVKTDGVKAIQHVGMVAHLCMATNKRLLHGYRNSNNHILVQRNTPVWERLNKVHNATVAADKAADAMRHQLLMLDCELNDII